MALIVESPIKNCPICKYSLHGLPPAHRCPECGFAYDECTVVFRPARPWLAYIFVLLPILFLLQMGVRPIAQMISLLTQGAVAVSAIFIILGGVILYYFFRIWSANKTGRFIALTRTGFTMRNFGGVVTSPWEDVAQVALYDNYPWIGRRSSEEKISLQNFVRSDRDRKTLKQAIERARALPEHLPPLTHQPNPTPVPDHRKVHARRLIVCGVSMMIGGYATAVVFDLEGSKTVGVVFGLLFWIGLGIALIGTWRSDPRKKTTTDSAVSAPVSSVKNPD